MASTILATAAQKWEVARVAERFARAAADRFSAEVLQPLDRAREAGRASMQQLLLAEDEYNRYTSAHAAAVSRLLDTPAPDVAAALVKLELAQAEDLLPDDSDEARHILQGLTADLRRLVRAETRPEVRA